MAQSRTPNYRLAARRAAQKFGVDPAIFEALINQESGFRPGVSSPAGAQGIAQFIPSTARAYGVNLHDRRVTDDLEGAARYLADNLRKTGGNYHQALSIYNSGRPDAYKDPGFANGQTYNYVRSILGAAGGGKVQGRGSTQGGTTATTRTIPGVDNSALRTQLVSQYVLDGQNPQALEALAAGLLGAKDTPGKTVTTTTRGRSGSMAAGGDAIASRANAIDKQHLPYQWGGGHGSTAPGTPLDCSGAVSKVLGINPRVASQFKTIGSPGHAPGGKGVTIYANDKHVLMEINGHFFGTSSTNPGGGAGWIPRSAISPEYLKGFTARHLAR